MTLDELVRRIIQLRILTEIFPLVDSEVEMHQKMLGYLNSLQSIIEEASAKVEDILAAYVSLCEQQGIEPAVTPEAIELYTDQVLNATRREECEDEAMGLAAGLLSDPGFINALGPKLK